MSYDIIRLTDAPHSLEHMASWFHEKWGIPLSAYKESMQDCLSGDRAVPEWYVAVENDRIIGGAGVIENDFHDRPDLTPNVCALFVEPDRRGKGVAGAILGFVCDDMKKRGINTLYLVTDHTSFYERYGWELFCHVRCDGEEQLSRMYIKNI
jgi:GNAT superfamily N-acetyltransferase